MKTPACKKSQKKDGRARRLKGNNQQTVCFPAIAGNRHKPHNHEPSQTG